MRDGRESPGLHGNLTNSCISAGIMIYQDVALLDVTLKKRFILSVPLWQELGNILRSNLRDCLVESSVEVLQGQEDETI